MIRKLLFFGVFAILESGLVWAQNLKVHTILEILLWQITWKIQLVLVGREKCCRSFFQKKYK